MRNSSGQSTRTIATTIFLAGPFVLIAIGVGAWWIWPIDSTGGIEYSIDGAIANLRSWGRWAAVGSIVIMVAHAFLPFPSEIITLANGMVFGPLWGTAITWVGSMLGALCTFGLVRFLGRPFVYRMLSDKQVQRLSEWSTGRGGVALLIGRLVPLVSFNLLNYGAALTDITWWTFIWATGLGILPLTILLNVFGDSVLTLTTEKWTWLLLSTMAMLGWWFFKRRSDQSSGKNKRSPKDRLKSKEL